MEIHLPNLETWYDLNEQVHRELGLSKDISVRVYRGIHHAAFEVAQGTASFFSHRRSVAWVKGQTFAYLSVLPYLYKEAFEVQQVLQKDLATTGKEWFTGLKKDTSFVMMTEDHPLTGETFANDEIDSLLNGGKIFSFRVSHAMSWLRRNWEVRPYSVLLCDLAEDLAIGIMGAKFKSPVQMASRFHFNPQYVLEKLRSRLVESIEEPAAIQAFEAGLPAEIKIFPRGVNSLMDRTLLYDPELNGEALSQVLAQNCGLKVGKDLIPLSGCYQGFADLDWWDGRPSAEVIRGMMILSLSAVKKIKSPSDFLLARQACQI